MAIEVLNIILTVMGFFVLVVSLFIWYSRYLPEREKEIKEKIRNRRWKYPVGNYGSVTCNTL